MKTRTLSLVALIAAASLNLVSPSLAQNYKTRCSQPQPCPGPELPGPVAASYFLGVYTSTAPVSGYNPQPVANGGGNAALVVPGYGETVHGQSIDQVVSNSPAYHAGLEPGDIIVSANGYSMESKEDLVAAIQYSEGYLEMQVLDSRSGELQWVVAEPEAQGTTPVLTSQRRQSSNSSVVQTRQQTQRPNNFKRSTGPSAQQLSDQIRSAVEQIGGRRPPVRRKR